ncbi:MAG TPA: hypothetical protein ENJ82_12400, partial [Bacteroidetes bacterium]|nr:hypothetical protein [Bacteroidota bacterium]
MVLLLLLTACSATEHLAPNQYLVRSDPGFRGIASIFQDTLPNGDLIFRDKEKRSMLLDEGLLASAIRTKANKRMLIPKTYLHLHNLGQSIAKNDYLIEKVWRFFLPNRPLSDTLASFLINTAGAPPELIDTARISSDIANLYDVYFSRGFFHPEITVRADTGR